MITGKNFIGYTASANTSTPFLSTIPDSGNTATPCSFYEATAAEINAAATLAGQAFSIYRQKSPAQKIDFLEKIAAQIAAQKDELVAMAMHETHLPKPRLDGEVQRTINQIKLFAGFLQEGSWVKAIIDTAQPERAPLPKPDIRQMQIAIGPVGVFGASNFPFAFSVAGGDTISALAAGCTVVCKAHPGHPATSEMVAAIILEAAKATDMPDGVFSLLQARQNQASIQLVSHPAIKAIGFTGSLTGGKALFDAAAKREEPIPVYAEMGSVNPVFILPEIIQQQPDTLAAKLAASNLLSAGQFCTNPGIIVSIEGPATQQFSQHFSQCIQNAGADDMLTSGIANNYYKHIQQLQQSPNVTALAQGKINDGALQATPYLFTVSAKTVLAQPTLLEEVFGPSSIHIMAANEAELYAVATQLSGQLTTSIWGTENDLAANANLVQILELKAGRIIFNNVPTGVEVTHAMVHGGPFPATTDSKTTSVGTNAIYRFTRAVCYQNCPQHLLPQALQNNNQQLVWRLVNGAYKNDSIE
jgi:2,5-dioxopentanoate dehydrogenase